MHSRQDGRSPYTALLCSPSPDDWKDLSSALEGLDIRVASAPSQRAALDLARDNCFVLILLDLDNDSHWKATLEKLRSHAPGAGVLAYSRLSEERLWLDALDAGAFDFVCKPFSRRELHWILENALRSRVHRPQPLPLSRKAREAVAHVA